MALGPGKYDDLVTELRLKICAAGVIVVIIGGDKGDGFSAQLPPEMTLLIPTVLREVARQIEMNGPAV